jgi:hypothetical protein
MQVSFPSERNVEEAFQAERRLAPGKLLPHSFHLESDHQTTTIACIRQSLLFRHDQYPSGAFTCTFPQKRR